MDASWQDVRYSTRTLLRSPGFTITAVLTLALGIGANATIFTVVHAVLLRQLPYRDAGRLISIWESNRREGIERAQVSPPDYVGLGETVRSLQQLAAYRPWGFVLTGGEEPERIIGARVSASLFPLLGVTPLIGRTLVADEDRFGGTPAVLLSESLWRRRFRADPGIVGRSLTLNGMAYPVVGVLPAAFRLPEADVWVPLALEPYVFTQRGARALTVLGRLAPRVGLAQANAELHAIAGRLQSEAPSLGGWDLTAVPLRDELVGGVRSTLLLLWAAVGMVLLIACANVANLALVRATGRRADTSLRIALGATRSRLVRQLLTESVLVALAGGVLGLLLTLWGTEALVRLGPRSLPRVGDIVLSRPVLGFTLLLSLVTGVAFGLVPAWRGSRQDLAAALREPHSGLRRAVMAGQVALTLVLLVASGLLLRSLARLQAVEPGFDPDGVLTMTISLPEAKYGAPERKAGFYAQLLERVRVLPGVAAAGLVSHLPVAGSALATDFSPEGRPTSGRAGPVADYVNAGPEYFRVLHIPQLEGRPFTARDAMDAPPVVVVSEALARKYWPGRSPVGRRLVLGTTLGADQRPREIVGVVGNVRSAGLESAPREAIYVPSGQNPWPTMSLVVRAAGDPMQLVAAVRSEVLALDPDQPVYNVRRLAQVLADSIAPRRWQLVLLGAFALLALTLAAVGVYGVVAYAAGRRTREIGIRLALGARPRDVLALVVRQGMGPVALGVAVGGVAALGATRLIARMLFGVTPTDPATFGAAAAFLAIVGLAASWLPARRASRVSPMESLRLD